jgi:Rieske Fe-S protein
MERREFLKRVIKVLFAFVGVVLLFTLAYVYPSRIKKRKLSYVYLMEEDDLPKQGVKKVSYHYAQNDRTVTNRTFVTVLDGSAVAFSPVCPHLGCLVNWDGRATQFICPCHGGKYDKMGNVVAGPPPRPLTRLPLKITEEKVFIGITV